MGEQQSVGFRQSAPMEKASRKRPSRISSIMVSKFAPGDGCLIAGGAEAAAERGTLGAMFLG